ncbi:hypothetical protein F5Y01DRAFT_292579 [Xylaria sp. FL0043]|nr:hypothetical protein F5Y01DRAFT_292579 [Xylaria sp. FL0043]
MCGFRNNTCDTVITRRVQHCWIESRTAMISNTHNGYLHCALLRDFQQKPQSAIQGTHTRRQGRQGITRRYLAERSGTTLYLYDLWTYSERISESATRAIPQKPMTSFGPGHHPPTGGYGRGGLRALPWPKFSPVPGDLLFFFGGLHGTEALTQSSKHTISSFLLFILSFCNQARRRRDVALLEKREVNSWAWTKMGNMRKGRGK